MQLITNHSIQRCNMIMNSMSLMMSSDKLIWSQPNFLLTFPRLSHINLIIICLCCDCWVERVWEIVAHWVKYWASMRLKWLLLCCASVLSCYPTVIELTSPGHKALADLTDPQHGPVQGKLQKYHAKELFARKVQRNYAIFPNLHPF